MKNKLLASFGIGAYTLSVLSSATDWQGNVTAPTLLIALSGIATVSFLIMATARLWREKRGVAIALPSSALVVLALSMVEGATALAESSPIAILSTLTRIANLVAVVWAIVTLFNMSTVRVADQRNLAQKLVREDSALAMRIAMGEADAPSGIEAAAVYATVCEEAEKADDLALCMQLANSLNNAAISATSQKLKLRDPDAAIEMMKEVVNARLAAFERTLPKGKTVAGAIDEEVRNLKVYFTFLQRHTQGILDTRADSEARIRQIEVATRQRLKKEQLANELLVLRYAFLQRWFFDIKRPKDQAEVSENIALFTRALEDGVAAAIGTADLSWLSEEVAEYFPSIDPMVKDLTAGEARFRERVAMKIPAIACECTEGRLGGEQYDAVVELIQTTIESDKARMEA